MDHPNSISEPAYVPAKAPIISGAPAWGRLAWRILRILLLAYLGVLLVLSYLQTWLIFPGAASQGSPDAVVGPPADGELWTLTTKGGDRVVALFGKALTPDGRPRPDADRRPSLIYFYGNGMCLEAAIPQFDQFRRLGVNVVIPDYLGYGMSGGQAGEAGCYATADAVYEALRARPDIDPDRIVAAGWSLGGAVAIDLASRRPVAGLAVFSTFTSLLDLARPLFPGLPISWLLHHRFESERKVAAIARPTLIVHGSRDTLIPPIMADRLAGAAGGPVTRLTVAGADHNDLFDVGGAPLARTFGAFLDALAAPSPGSTPVAPTAGQIP